MTTQRLLHGIALAAVLTLLGGCAFAPSSTSADALASNPSPRADRFYLDHCPLCGTRFGVRGEALELTHGERELRLCSQGCVDEFHRDPVAAAHRIDAELIADQRPFYPIERSLFTAAPLPVRSVDFIWGNRLFRAADGTERRRILAEPADAFARLDRAVIAAQRPIYGMPDKCPVQGDILPSEQRIDIVVANRMIRVCCMRCVRVVRARPYQYLAMVEYANRAEAQRRSGDPGVP